MIDRLYELRQRNPVCQPKLSDSQHNIMASHCDSQQRYIENTEGISEQFFEEVRRAKAYINQIKGNNDRTQQLRSQYAKAIKPSQEKECTEGLDAIVRQNTDIHNNLKAILSEMKNKIEADETDEELKNQPETRMKRNFYLSLANQLSKTLQQQRIQQDSFKKCMKQKLARQVILIDQNLTQDQVDHYVNNPQQAQQMLQKRIYGMASADLRNAVSDIQDKFRDIQKLERSVAECLQLFKELAVLVQEQGALIDNIELNVNQTKDYVEKATKNLQKAREHHRCTRKWMIWTIVIGIILVVVTLAIVLAVVLN